MKLKLTLICIIISFSAFAQETNTEKTDSLEVKNNMEVYLGFVNSLNIQISAPDSINNAMLLYINNNSVRKIISYKIRIYFDNSQNARTISGEMAIKFTEKYPNVFLKREYKTPYWKVTVGNFRTESEAMRFMEEIRIFYPTVFLVEDYVSTI
ncbi:MAG: SPOR domain-containing protein [Bacteroidales bacterium]